MLNRINFRRAGVALVAPALAAGIVVAAPSAQAAPNSYAYSAARWLSDQPENGIVSTVYDGTAYPDYGLSLDVFFALNELDTRAGDQAEIISAFEADPSVYIGGGSAGAAGKLATAVEASGPDADATAFGGQNLIATVESRIVASGDETGRAVDAGVTDYSNSIGQSWVVRSLATSPTSTAKLTSATDYLLKQQCATGAFRTNMFAVAVPDDTNTPWPDGVLPVDRACGDATTADDDQITIDATAFGIQALLSAKDAGVANLQDDIDAAVSWLLKQQAANGSFVNDDNANTNTTGLAAATLKSVGQTGAAGSAASWIVAHQVTDAIAEDTALASELGAIAFDQDALAAGKTAGIPDDKRDQWVRASAQAAIGVDAQLPAKKLLAKAPAGYVASGTSISVSATGLAAGEKFTASVAGGTTVAGTATAAGVASAKVKTGASTATRTVTIKGSRSNRVGTASVKVLAAKKLALKLSSTVKKNKKQTVKASGLASGETVKIYFAGKLVKTSKANSSGKYNYSFKVGKKAGKKTVKVVGAFKNRTGSKSFKVK